VIADIPANVVARRSIIAQRSSRPGPASPCSVSLPVPKKNSAATAVMTPSAPSPAPTSSPIQYAASIASPMPMLTAGVHHRLRWIGSWLVAVGMKDLLYWSAEVAGERDRERERGRVALLLDRVDRLAGDAHGLAQLFLGETHRRPQRSNFVLHDGWKASLTS
jgi:hypothetical protein